MFSLNHVRPLADGVVPLRGAPLMLRSGHGRWWRGVRVVRLLRRPAPLHGTPARLTGAHLGRDVGSPECQHAPCVRVVRRRDA